MNRIMKNLKIINISHLNTVLNDVCQSFHQVNEIAYNDIVIYMSDYVLNKLNDFESKNKVDYTLMEILDYNCQIEVDFNPVDFTIVTIYEDGNFENNIKLKVEF
jgi:hypothetical protein